MMTDDISRVSELMCLCYRWLGKHDKFTDAQVDFLVSERGSMETIKNESSSQIYMVACSNNIVVGMAAIKANEIAKLYVDTNYHRQGIGAMLFNAAEQLIGKNGHKEMIVGVMARSAIGFYEKMGMTLYDTKIVDTGAFAGYQAPLMKKIFA